MAKVVDYFYALQSPFAYLGSALFEEILDRQGATAVCKPANFMAVFEATGGLPLPKRSPARQKYRLVELERWREVRGVPLNLQPAHFPVADLPAATLVIAAEKSGQDALALSHAIMRAVWAEERDVSDPATLKAIADAAGLDGATLLEAAEVPSCATQYEANTAEAIERNVFGAPFFFYGDEPFWGQDRLDLLDRALQR